MYLAQPPLYRIDIGKETFWALDDAQKDADPASSAPGRAHAGDHAVQGPRRDDAEGAVGDDAQPAHAAPAAVEIADQLVTDRVINELMGKDASARFRFIMDRAEDAEELDV